MDSKNQMTFNYTPPHHNISISDVPVVYPQLVRPLIRFNSNSASSHGSLMKWSTVSYRLPMDEMKARVGFDRLVGVRFQRRPQRTSLPRWQRRLRQDPRREALGGSWLPAQACSSSSQLTHCLETSNGFVGLQLRWRWLHLRKGERKNSDWNIFPKPTFFTFSPNNARYHYNFCIATKTLNRLN